MIIPTGCAELTKYESDPFDLPRQNWCRRVRFVTPPSPASPWAGWRDSCWLRGLRGGWWRLVLARSGLGGSTPVVPGPTGTSGLASCSSSSISALLRSWERRTHKLLTPRRGPSGDCPTGHGYLDTPRGCWPALCSRRTTSATLMGTVPRARRPSRHGWAVVERVGSTGFVFRRRSWVF